MNSSLQMQVALYCSKHGYPIPTLEIKQSEEDKYEGLKECFRNVVRTNNSKKLQYCKAR